MSPPVTILPSSTYSGASWQMLGLALVKLAPYLGSCVYPVALSLHVLEASSSAFGFSCLHTYFEPQSVFLQGHALDILGLKSHPVIAHAVVGVSGGLLTCRCAGWSC